MNGHVSLLFLLQLLPFMSYVAGTLVHLPPTSFSRSRRDTKNEPLVCKSVLNEDVKDKLKKHMFPLKTHKHVDVTLVWLGDKRETQILLTTVPPEHSFLSLFKSMTNSMSPTNVYRSTDGGRTFDLIQSEIGKQSIRSSDGIFKSPVDPKRLILVSRESLSFQSLFMRKKADPGALVTTVDGGQSFTVHKLPFKVREGDSIRFHPTRKDWIIAFEKEYHLIAFGSHQKTGCAFLSKDFGKSWTSFLKDEIIAEVQWGTSKGHEDEIFAITKKGNGKFVMPIFAIGEKMERFLWKSSNQKNFTKIVEGIEKFGMKEEFIFLTVVLKGNDDEEKKIVHISHDSGENFNTIHVPAIASDRFYAVLEMYKGLIFLHIDEPGATGKGDFFISGPEGRVYEKTLENHFFTNSLKMTDFYKVESMPGVYMTQTLQNDSTLNSVITFDRGVKWQPLKLDRSKYCTADKYKDKTVQCSLHYHHLFSRSQNPAIRTYVESPKSSASAPGLLILHGVAGDGLTGQMDVWMSKNGGYDWTEIAKGPHHYAIGDNGNLIVLVPKLNTTGTTLKYSIDQGRCWHTFEFMEKDIAFMVHGLVAEPHSQELSFSLWGINHNETVAYGGADGNEWKIITIDFGTMLTKKCGMSDFENWKAHKSNGKEGCFLGSRSMYQRPKEDSVCYVGRDFNPVVQTTKCKCNDDDFVCDYGYKRNKDNKCVRDITKSLMFCENGKEELESPSKGYRRVPGDTCDNNNSPNDLIKMIDEHKKCEENSETNAGIMKYDRESEARQTKILEEAEKRAEAQLQMKEKNRKKKKRSSVLPIFVAVFIILIAVAAIVYGVRHYRARNNGARFVTLNEEDASGSGEGPTRRDNRRFGKDFHDETDNEDEGLLEV